MEAKHIVSDGNNTVVICSDWPNLRGKGEDVRDQYGVSALFPALLVLVFLELHWRSYLLSAFSPAGSSKPLWDVILYTVSDVPLPTPGKDLALFAIENCLLSVEAPPKDGLPHVEEIPPTPEPGLSTLRGEILKLLYPNETGIDQMKAGLVNSSEQYFKGCNKPWGEDHDLQLSIIFTSILGLWLRLLKLRATDDPLSSFEYGTILALIGGGGFVECIRENIHSGWHCELTDEQFIAVKELRKTAISCATSRNDVSTIEDSAEIYKRDANNVSDYVQRHLISLCIWEELRFWEELFALCFSPAGSSKPLWDVILYTVSDVPLPTPGKDLVLFAIENCLLSVEAPPKDGLPHVEPLVQCLDVDNFRKLLTAVLHEWRILLRSNKDDLDLCKAPGCVLLEVKCIVGLIIISVEPILFALVYHYQEMHVYIPLLFFSGVDYFDAPTPYMTGLHSSVGTTCNGQCFDDFDPWILSFTRAFKGLDAWTTQSSANNHFFLTATSLDYVQHFITH
uniref:cDENN domain-containing protein n=1 Tax=Salix viminalis TaxID=40686 RepID=A0A6N2MG58_SALVM